MVGHIYNISNFRVQQSKGIRKCTECGAKIPKEEFCLKAHLLDRCPHYMWGKRIFMNKPVQLCAKCVDDGVAQRLLQTYRRPDWKQPIEDTIQKFRTVQQEHRI
jgi:hypothetical protein